MPEADYGNHTRWLTCFTINPNLASVDQETIRLHLATHNIESRPVWKPLHLQPVFADCEVIGGEVAEDLSQDVLELITVFSARLYSSMSHMNKQIVKELRDVADRLK